MIKQFEITLPSFPKGFHLITKHIDQYLKDLPKIGLVNIFIKHTSAGLTINENADPSVREDFERFMNSLIPEKHNLFTHTLEGPDDMPAHIKTSLFGPSLNIPVSNHKLNLGTWQGIYLCEFRHNGGNRSLMITIYE